jgi:RNA polymerase sigma-70 factor (ECF subfamily)
MDTRWLEAAFAAARPQAVGALLRHFRNLDLAEEAFQEACLRALMHWPKNGPPRDATAWLVFVGRNIARDHLRKSARLSELPEDESQLSNLEDAETAVAHSMDHASVGDDVLRLLFVCCHENLPATQQIALALRIVAGLSVAQIARAFLVSEAALEQRITRAAAIS